MDPLVANLLWAALLGIALGAIVGVLVAASGKRRGEGGDPSGPVPLTSLRYVLEGDGDDGALVLSRLPSGDPEALAAAFGLGELFRRKGDLGRAVRIHEAILAVPGLSAEWRAGATFELGLDFRRLGMFARAMEAFEKVVDADPFHAEALRELRELCEEVGDWEGATRHQERLEGLRGAQPALSAHLHAGHARKLLSERCLDDAARVVALGEAADPRSADVRVAGAELHLARGEGAEAVAALSEALELRPEILSAIVPLLEGAFLAQDRYPALGDFLGERLEANPDDASLRLALARHLRRRRLLDEAAGQLRRILEADPQNGEARLELGELLLEGGPADGLETELRALLKGPGNTPRPFACGGCGMELTQFFFRCPRCYGWDTIGRIRPPKAAEHDIPRLASATGGADDE
ncbi:tetratricopeptide repeat protein [Vulgatibacter incomptus]|uniref:Heat shock (Putative periplasmic) protein YciM n=1 Tax=Vulgatibacter incomptus TaxID=1391653 RepID=A0A0K1PC93_9BACT|nr:tetratricopeptide repeat protein [Vulgatibacter incomptus]AKU91036.1 Heat shock (putative periplasmic) protein YciM, precursor [Vulgatibacter incomptus]